MVEPVVVVELEHQQQVLVVALCMEVLEVD
jgi:hypothetical protein